MNEINWDSKLEHIIEMVDPDQLLANFKNARTHPGAQRNAIRASLNRVGWVAPVIVNRRTNMVMDGHARIEEALTAGVQVPVAYVDISSEQEAYALATFDPIGAMAGLDDQKLTDLLLEIETTGDPGFDAWLAELANLQLDMSEAGDELNDVEWSDEPVAISDVETDNCCPKCSFKW